MNLSEARGAAVVNVDWLVGTVMLQTPEVIQRIYDAIKHRAQSVAAQPEIVERMVEIYDTYFKEPCIHTSEGDIQRMTAAAHVCLDEALKPLSPEEGAPLSVDQHITVDRALANRRARLSAPKGKR